MFAPTAAAGALRFPLRLERDEPIQLTIKALCGRLRSATQCHVFTKQLRLPRFAMWSFLGTTDCLVPWSQQPGRGGRGGFGAGGLGSPFGASSGFSRGGAAQSERAMAPSGSVQFSLDSEEVSRIGLWAQQRFLLPQHAMRTASSSAGGRSGSGSGGGISMAFQRLAPIVAAAQRDKMPAHTHASATATGAHGESGLPPLLPVLTIVARMRGASPGSADPIDRVGHGGCVVQVGSSSLALATTVIQDMFEWLNVRLMGEGPEHGSLEVSLPSEAEQVLEAGHDIKEQQSMRLRLSAEAADRSNSVKALVARAEDARLTEDVGGLRRSYARLQEVSAELLGEHARRTAAHSRLMSRLKWINECI